MKSLKSDKVKVSNILLDKENISKLDELDISLSSFFNELLSSMSKEDINNIKRRFRNDETINNGKIIKTCGKI